MKVLICVNSTLAALHGLPHGLIVDIRNEGCALCEHESRHYDAIRISDELWREIEPAWSEGKKIVYDHGKELLKYGT